MSSGGTAATIAMNSANGVTISNPFTLANNLTINGTGAGTLALNGALSGQASLTYAGTSTLSLGGSGSSYIGGTNVNSGTLALGGGSAIPTGSSVTVNNGGTFNTEGLSNATGTAVGTLTLNNNATFRVPTGSGNYYLNQLTLGGGTVDVTGSSNFWMHFVGAGAGITVNSSSSTIGAAYSRMQNDTGGPLPINVASGATLYAGMILSGFGGNPTFVKSGGGELALSNTGNSANITVTGGVLSTFDMSSNVGSGANGTLGTGTITLAGAVLAYNGVSATTAKPLALAGGALIQAGYGVNLTLTGVVSETVANSNLQLAGPPYPDSANQGPVTFTLTAANTYTGPTYVAPDVILAVPAVANGGVASPLGAASNAVGNLLLGTGFRRRRHARIDRDQFHL